MATCLFWFIADGSNRDIVRLSMLKYTDWPANMVFVDALFDDCLM